MNRNTTFWVTWLLGAIFLFVAFNWRLVATGEFGDHYSFFSSGDGAYIAGAVLGMIVGYGVPSLLVASLASLAARKGK